MDFHPKAIAQDGAAREWAGGVHCDHRDPPILGAGSRDYAIGEGALSCTRRTGNPQHKWLTGAIRSPGIQGRHSLQGTLRTIVNSRNCSGQRPPVSSYGRIKKRIAHRNLRW
jgi:hypothetical protein